MGELERFWRRKSVWDEERGEQPRTSRWEVTPRTATQSKRLKWDQTPLGYIRVEDDSWSGSRVREMQWDEERGEKTAALYSEMSLREINMCLPAKGYRRYNLVQTSEHEAAEDLPEIPEDERDFFMPVHSRDADAEIYRGLLFLKSGKGGRKMLTRPGMDANKVLEKAVLMAMSLELTAEEKARVVDLMQTLLEGIGVDSVQFIRETLFVLGSYAYFYPLRKASMAALSLMYRDGPGVLRKIEEECSSTDMHIREIAGKIVGTAVGYLGMKQMEGFLRRMAGDGRDAVRRTFARAVASACSLVGRAFVPDMEHVLDMLCSLLADRNRFVRVDAANALSAVFKTMRPFRNMQTDNIFFILRGEALNARAIELRAFLRAMSLLCHSEEFSEMTFEVLDASEKSVSELKVFERICSLVGQKRAQKYFAETVEMLFSLPKEHHALVSSICVKMAVHRETARLVLRFYTRPECVGLVSEIFSRVALDLDGDDAETYYSSIRGAVGQNDAAAGLADLLVNKRCLQPRFIRLIAEDAMRLMRGTDSGTRVRGLTTMRRIASLLDMRSLEHCGAILFENMGEKDQLTLAAVLETMHAVYNCRRFKSASELVPGILPILKSREAGVVEAATSLLHTVCVNASAECEKVGAKEWLRISYELVDALTSWRRRTRRNAVETLGRISRIVGPQEVLNILMDSLESEDKHQRMGSSLAISVVAEYCGVFSVLPTLLTDYELPSAFVQQGILRTLSHVFQRTRVAENLIHAVLPVVEDAMMDEDPGYRGLGLGVIKHIVLNSPQADTSLLVHLLNLVWPNILDYTPLVRSAFDECIEAFCTALSSQALYRYILQGIFHPSQAVQQRYRSVFGTMKHFDSTTLAHCFLVEEDT